MSILAIPVQEQKRPALDDHHLLQMWLQGRAANTEAAYGHEAAVFSRFLHGRPLLSAQPTDLQAYAYSLQHSQLALGSQRRALVALRSLFKFALDIGEIDREPTRTLRTPKVRDTLATRILSVGQVRAIVAAARGRLPVFSQKSYGVLNAAHLLGLKVPDLFHFAKNGGWRFPQLGRRQQYNICYRPGLDRRHFLTRDLRTVVGRCPPLRDYVLIRTLYETGARISEVLGLRWPDAAVQINGEVIVTIFGKGGRTRSVRISADVWRLMQKLREGSTSDGFIFRTQWGGTRALGRVHFTRICHLLAKLAGIDIPISPHWFRHAHASHSLDNGCPIHVLKEQLGHASLDSTERYLHVRPGESSGRYLPAVEAPKAKKPAARRAKAGSRGR